MNATSFVMAIVVLATVWIAATSAQTRPYNVIMKDVASAFGGLRKAVDASDLSAASDNAARLERLFKETEDFWTRFKTRDAIDAAKGARELSASIVNAAAAKDLQKARTAAGGLGKFCAACHDSHREQMPDKTYRIRP
jgi:cytochrome c556